MISNVALVVRLSLWVLSLPQQEVISYLPPGAVVEEVTTYDQAGRPLETRPGIFHEDFDGDGIDEVVVVYAFDASDALKRRLYMRVMRKAKGGYELLLDYHSPGKFLFSSEGVRILDLNGDGKKELILVSSNSASLGGILTIFGFSDGQFNRLFETAGFSYSGISFQDIDGDGKLELILAARYTGDINAPSQIFSWEGETYLLASERFHEFYKEEVQKYLELLKRNLADEADTLARVGVLTFIAQDYELLKDKEKAAHFYQKVLEISETELRKIGDENTPDATKTTWQGYKVKALAGLKRLTSDR